jgi:hypothetical protein
MAILWGPDEVLLHTLLTLPGDGQLTEAAGSAFLPPRALQVYMKLPPF